MRTLIERVVSSPRTVPVAAALTLLIGLIFVFVWAPHPWGWRGIDQYHQLALELARGESFGTTDVPWAYAYYVAAFYALFGEHAWLPVTVQVVANAFVPVLLYRLAVPITSHRVATLAALLIGVFSFNTVYASTQSSDALCTVTFLGALLLWARGTSTQQLRWFALSGLLAGLVPQFRPNMILLPVAGAALLVIGSRDRRRALLSAAVFLVMVAVALAPWTIRNFRLTGTFLPTSSHGGVQLWYGSLQTGDYLESRAHNPRSVFETPAFDYFSLAGPTILVSAAPRGCAPAVPASAALVYSTDRDRSLRRVPGERQDDGSFTFEIPGQSLPTVVYYSFETHWPARGDRSTLVSTTPAAGPETPFVVFVSDTHLGDMDIHHDVLDVFDVARLVRHLAWRVPPDGPADHDGNGTIDNADLRALIAVLLPASGHEVALDIGADVATLRFRDDSVFSVPRSFERVTDIAVSGGLATALSYARVPRWMSGANSAVASDVCRELENITVNDVFYRREPHMMRRYTALAFDNIRRDPGAFLAASAYRAIRLFVIRGTSDQMTTQQFRSSAVVYAAGTLLSLTYLALFVAGLVISVRRGLRIALLLVPILYVPATICFVLTNMRYTITVQPLMFVFVAVALLALFDRRSAAAVSHTNADLRKSN